MTLQNDKTDNDAPIDAPADTPSDMPIDAPAEALADACADDPIEVAADARADESIDAPADAPAEAPGEGPSDASAAEPAEIRTGRVSEELKSVIEALVYASPDPLTPTTLFKVLDSEPREDVQVSLEALRRDYAEGQGGLQLVEVAGGYQIVTRPELSEWVRRLFHERKTQKLSVAALETLAVIAYKQPVTAPEITEIRGVNAAGVVATLLERHLIKIAGRKQVVGRPFLYATTREFLIRFGLRDLSDLPKMEDMAEVLGFEPPSGLADAGPSETLLPLDGAVDPDKTLNTDEPQ
jgi:segregation and condensation protein B